MKEDAIRSERPKERTVCVRSLRDYDGVPSEYLEIAQSYTSPLLAGPPLCDELVELVMHMFDADEVHVMRHIKPFGLGKTSHSIAATLNRPVDEVDAILKRLSEEKCIIMSRGSDNNKNYFLIPLFPGVMENILFRNSREGLTPWHQRFAFLFDKLYNTGYILDYNKHPAEMVRFLPVHQSIASHAQAWPSDKLEEILDRFQHFAVTYCQCRLTMDLKGESCGKPLETCVLMGDLAEQMIHKGRMRRVDKQEVFDIKKNAEAHGLVTWVGNAEYKIAGSNISCSCCGCCCYALRLITQFNTPAMIAPPHFLPQHDATRCKTCGACALTCQTKAVKVDTFLKTRTFDRSRCIGCGLCVGACAQTALSLQEIPDYKRPPRNTVSYLAKIMPNAAKNTLHAFKTHKVK